MKRKVFLSILLILTVLFSSFAYATEGASVNPISAEPENTEVTSTNEKTEEPNVQEISGTYFIAEENASLQDAIVDGNIFAFGTNVSLNNVVVYGDIFVAGQNVTFSNIVVYGTAFLAGETVNMNNAKFAGNIFNASQTMNFSGIAQDIFAAAQNIKINAETIIAREIFATAENVNLEGGKIGKSTYITTDELTVGPTVSVTDTLNYSSTKEANISSDSIIGNVNFNKLEEKTSEGNANLLGSKVYSVVVIAIKSIFVCGFIFLFAKGFMEKQKLNVAKYIGVNTLKGLGWTVLIPIISMLLLFTGVSFGLSFVTFALYCIIFWLGVPVVAITITSNVTAKQEYNAWKFYGYSVLISIILGILKQIPTIGGMITVIVSLAGMGIVFSSLKKKKDKKDDSEKLEAEVVEEN